MATPTTRDEFKAYILRRLGSPVINIEVSDDQIDDRVDDALKYYWDHHFAGSEKFYFKYQLTADDRTNRYITIPEEITSVLKIFPLNGISSRMNIFDIRYQIALNDLYTLTSQSMVPYFMTMQHLGLLQELLVGQKPIRFNRHTNQLWLDVDWATVVDGDWVVAECNQNIDPELYPDVWGDRWLLQYATALTKLQWGGNIGKFPMQLPGGVVLNADRIINEAREEIQDLEDKMINDFSLPLDFETG